MKLFLLLHPYLRDFFKAYLETVGCRTEGCPLAEAARLKPLDLSLEIHCHKHSKSMQSSIEQGFGLQEAMLHGRYNGYGGLDFAAPPISPLHFGVANPFDLPFPHFPGISAFPLIISEFATPLALFIGRSW